MSNNGNDINYLTRIAADYHLKLVETRLFLETPKLSKLQSEMKVTKMDSQSLLEQFANDRKENRKTKIRYSTYKK